MLLDDPAQRMNKLAPRWKGPFVILRCIDKGNSVDVTYEITDPKKRDSRKWFVHHTRLKAFKGRLSDESTNSTEPSKTNRWGTVPDHHQLTITALSGAIPYQPPIPLDLPSQSQRASVAADVDGNSQGGVSPDSAPRSTAPLCPVVLPSADVVLSVERKSNSTLPSVQLLW